MLVFILMLLLLVAFLEEILCLIERLGDMRRSGGTSGHQERLRDLKRGCVNQKDIA